MAKNKKKQQEQIKPSADERVRRYISGLDSGLTYAEVGRLDGVSGEAVRNIIRRYNHRLTGAYTGIRNLPSDYAVLAEEVTRDTSPEDISQELDNFIPPVLPRIVIIDIERLPNVGFFWQPKTRDGWIPESMVMESSRMISFAAKTLNGPIFFSSEFHHGRDNMLKSLWHIMDSADILITYNGRRFDVPHIAGELREAGYKSYRPFKHIDLFTSIKNKFGYDYKNLQSVAKRWGLSQKMETGGIDLWKGCYLGDPESWNTMKLYNIQDVRVTENLYLSNLSWLAGTIPNLGLWVSTEGGALACPACASTDVESHGSTVTGVTRYAVYKCGNCGYHSRSNERIASTVLRPATW